YIGLERTAHDAVNPHFWSERIGQTLGHYVEARLGRRVRNDMRPRPDSPGARHVDDAATGARRHAGTDGGAQPKRTLQIDRHGLVEEILGDVEDAIVGGRDTGVVDKNVDPAETLIGILYQPVDLIPTAHVTRQPDSRMARLFFQLQRNRIARILAPPR